MEHVGAVPQERPLAATMSPIDDRRTALAAMMACALLAACAGGSPQRGARGAAGMREEPPGTHGGADTPPAERLPPVPWRDSVAPAAQSGTLYWSDVPRNRLITARWSAPPPSAVRGLVIMLPALAQGDQAAPSLVDALNAAGFAVLTLGHPGNDATVWTTPQARNADFAEAARRHYTMAQARQRVADVRFVLDELQRDPPAWLPPAALQRIGVTGIGLGAQTAQWLAGEQMTAAPPAAEPRIRAVALLGPYVGFEGPGLHQRYLSVHVPMLIIYGSNEVEPFGLGMPAQQRRAMVDQLVNAPIVEVRLPVSLAALLGSSGPHGTAREGDEPRTPPARREAGGPGGGGGRGPGGGGSRSPGGGASGPGGSSPTGIHRDDGGGMGGPTTMSGPPGARDPRLAGVASRDAEVARTALHFSTVAFFEADLLGSTNARDWLVGPHPAPVQWSVRSAGATVPASR